MLIINKFLLLREIWFAKKASCIDFFGLTKLRQYRSNKYFGFIKKDFWTKIIRLDEPDDKIFNNFRDNTKYKIKRAEREGIKFDIIEDYNTFLKFYNEFAMQKKLGLLKNIDHYLPFMVFTAASFNNEMLCVHAYLLDKSIKRARLLYSASHFRKLGDSKMKNLIGRANRFLHYKDILYFKGKGFLEYDLGGYAINSDSIELKNIAEFKDSFGGVLVYEPELTSILFYIFKKVYYLLKRK